MNRWTIRCGVLAIAVLAATAGQGCNLIAGLDDVQFGGGGHGGGGGPTTSTGGAAGTSITNPPCDPAACPAPVGECEVAVCKDDACAVDTAPDGTLAAAQTPGDCKKRVCMAGAAVVQDDGADPLDDGNDCTDDICAAGRPESMSEPVGTPCTMGGNVCDGAGHCLECVMDAQCTDPDKPVCDANTCVDDDCVNNALDAGETDIDCGGPCKGCDTGEGCLIDDDCFHHSCGGDGTCAAPTCSDGLQNGGEYLTGKDGETDVDCGGLDCGASCKAGNGCNVDGDCIGAQCTGVGGTCVPNCMDTETNNAETDIDCGGGTCGGCAVGQACAGMDTNCVAAAYCEADDKCAAKKPPGAGCMGNNQCAAGVCAPGDMVCCDSACAGTCESCLLAGSAGACSLIPPGQDPENDCAGAQVCNGASSCVKPIGETCAANSECLSGQCVDGVCCNAACAGVCQACNVAGSLGTCAAVPAGTDPAMECSGALNCNGLSPPACLKANGGSCGAGAECTSGNCIDGVCCNSTCSGVCKACNLAGSLGTCSNISSGLDPGNECPGATNCNGAGACLLKANGVSCAANAECQSAHCVDGLCCDTTCTGVCRACDVAGSLGTCAFIPGGTDPDNECSMATTVCDGAGTCVP